MINTENTEWFSKAKYGLFVHWGLYSIPAGEWNGTPSPYGAEWIMRYMQIPVREYRQLANSFEPRNFDAYEYVRLAKRWGMKYITVTAKHHDGFALFNSKASDYNVMNTPYGRDIIGEFAEACRKENIIFCVYYSQMQDWEHPDGDGNTWDFKAEDKKFERYFYEKALPQVRELLTNYGRIGMIWFDTPYDMPVELCRRLREEVKNCQPDCLINGRIGYRLGDYRNMADNSIPTLSFPEPWECPMTLNDTWGYSKHDRNWKPVSKVLENLTEVVGKGGNVLLNIGPDADGVIPEESVKILDEIGAFLKANGESIYVTVAAPDFPYRQRWGCITYNGDRHILYLHIRNYTGSPCRRISLLGLKNKVLSAYALATGEKLEFTQPYEVAREEERLYLYLPKEPANPYDTVVALMLDGEVKVQSIAYEDEIKYSASGISEARVD